MRISAAWLGITVALLAALDVEGQAAEPPVPVEGKLEPDVAAPVFEVVCVVSGYDVVLRNEGAVAIPPETIVDWEVPYARKEGRYVLSSPLEPGGQVFLTAVLGSSYLDPKKPCNAGVIESDAAAGSPED